MATSETLERLKLPLECNPFDGVLANPKTTYPYLERNVEVKFTRQGIVKTILSEELKQVTAPAQSQGPRLSLNYISMMVHGVELNDETHIAGANVSFVRKPKTKVIEEGPQAGQEFWFMGHELTCSPSGVKLTNTSIYTNAEKDGSPSEGWVNFPVVEKTKVGTKTTTYRRFEVFRKGVLEAKFNKTSEELAAMGCFTMDLTKPASTTHLLNVSTDLELIAENVYWPNVYLNGRDDNSFDFRKLIPPYAGTTPDFVVRIRAYNDSTNADYPAPNYSGLGNWGKCLDIYWENESVKPIRVEFGEQFSVEDLDNEYVITFDQSHTRAAIGMCVEYKPLDGKKVDHETYVDLKTNTKTLNIFELT